MRTWKQLKNNPTLFPRYFTKEYIIKACRKFFEDRNYHELESPIITTALPQERYLDVLETTIELSNKRKLKAYLTPTTETYNKKILSAGLGNHFVITKVLRGLEDIGVNHSPEFTMLEWYELGNTYINLMDSTEELLRFILKYIKALQHYSIKEISNLSVDEINNLKEVKNIPLTLDYLGKTINIKDSFYRFSIPEILKKYLNIELSDINDTNNFINFAKNRGYKVDNDDEWQTIFELIFGSEIEDKLPIDKPVFLYDFPKIMCPLTKENPANPLVCQKVELYMFNKEIANGYTELIDGDEQEKRFIEEQNARKRLKMKEIAFDYDLIDALKSGLPDVSGIGMGLDRLAMIYANAKNISEINYFPISELINEE